MNKKKAQQLAEFALVVPVLLIVILIIMEMGLAINIRAVLADSIKIAVVEATQNNVNSNSPADDFLSRVNASLSNTLNAKGFEQNIELQLVDIPSADKVMVIASTKYEPSFGLNNMFAGIIPQEFHLSSYQVVNRNYLEINQVDGLKGSQVYTFWDSPTGLMAGTDIGDVGKDKVRGQVAFLVDVGSESDGTTGTQAKLFNWEGHDLLPVNSYFDLTTGYYKVKSPYFDNDWRDTDDSLSIEDILIALGYTHGVYVKPQNQAALNKNDPRKKTAANGDISWATDNIENSSTDIKNGLNLIFGSGNTPNGSYEKVQGFNNPEHMQDNTIEEYLFKSTSPQYLLKLYLPEFSLNSTGVLKRKQAMMIGSNTETENESEANFRDAIDNFNALGEKIVFEIIDSDGDFIADKYDRDPYIPDMNMNGILDGLEPNDNLDDFTTSGRDKFQKPENTMPMQLPNVATLRTLLGNAYDYCGDETGFYDADKETPSLISALDPTKEEPTKDKDLDKYIDIDGTPTETINYELGELEEDDKENICYGFWTGNPYRIKYLILKELGENNLPNNPSFMNNPPNNFYSTQIPMLTSILPVTFERIIRKTWKCGVSCNLISGLEQGTTMCNFLKNEDEEMYEPLYYCNAEGCFREPTIPQGITEIPYSEILRGLDTNYTLGLTPEYIKKDKVINFEARTDYAPIKK